MIVVVVVVTSGGSSTVVGVFIMLSLLRLVRCVPTRARVRLTFDPVAGTGTRIGTTARFTFDSVVQEQFQFFSTVLLTFRWQQMPLAQFFLDLVQFHTTVMGFLAGIGRQQVDLEFATRATSRTFHSTKVANLLQLVATVMDLHLGEYFIVLFSKRSRATACSTRSYKSRTNIRAVRLMMMATRAVPYMLATGGEAVGRC